MTDIIGKKSFKLTFVYQFPNEKGIPANCVCVCDCGNFCKMRRNHFISKNTKSCGCLNYKTGLASAVAKDLTGQKFNKLLALERFTITKNNKPKTVYRCQCDCGKEKIVSGVSLANSNTKSCGCWNIESIIARNKDPELIKKRLFNANDSGKIPHWKTGVDCQYKGGWEQRILEYLNLHKIPYDWQIPFKLSNGSTYLCDMYLPNDNKYVEIKGWWREDGKLKFNLAISDNPTLTFEVWDKDKLDSLKIPIRKIPST